MILPKDHPDGPKPVTIEETSSDLAKFHEALGIMANESQVLILIDTNQIRDEVLHFMSLLAEKLPEGSYVEHHRFKQDNQGASDWVKALHYMQSDEMRKMIKKKYLISDWLSAAGYEVPSVIFVTRDLDKPWNATHCQRAKAKLVIYKMLDAPEASYYPASDSGSGFGSESEMAASWLAPSNPYNSHSHFDFLAISLDQTYGFGSEQEMFAMNKITGIKKLKNEHKSSFSSKSKKDHSGSGSELEMVEPVIKPMKKKKKKLKKKQIEQMVSTCKEVQQGTENLQGLLRSSMQKELMSSTTLSNLEKRLKKCDRYNRRYNRSVKALAKVISDMPVEQTSNDEPDNQTTRTISQIVFLGK